MNSSNGNIRLRPFAEKIDLSGWLIAILMAAVINIAMFGMMPGLVADIPSLKKLPDTIGDIVQVIRIKSPENPVEKREMKPEEIKPEIAKPRAVKERQERPQDRQEELKIRPRLPFEINSALPKISSKLVMPPPEYFSMDIEAPEVSPEDTVVKNMAPPVKLNMKDLYGTGELDGAIVPILKTAPIYPVRAKRRGIEGWVKVRFRVDTAGSVSHPEIISSEPSGLFEDSVLKCVRHWRFRPGTVNGKKVNTLVETTVRFELR